ncbi:MULTISPECIES: MFS transporter [Bacillaceae]|uniref:MFS transporter n=1 Tax=Evansella alkalicola TaxID=745819 RepID=A0ABS6JXH5_9BACI|nr:MULTISPECIES: MFS transporter [Bacillaceae]MBU9721815.1 MFS transporter [Bacillus alkalicola]
MKGLERSFYSKASMYSFIVLMVLFFLLWMSTGQFTKVKWASSGYMIASIIFFIGMTIRLTAWGLRPATQQMIKRSFQNMKTKKRQKRNTKAIVTTLVDNIILQKYIFKRGIYRGVQHWLIAWGCIGSLAITFALTFNWMSFKMVDPSTFAVVVFGFETLKMHPESIFAEMSYNALNITSSMLLVGLVMAITRRLKNNDLKVTERAEFDLLPLYLMLAMTVSGLVLTVSYKFLSGWMHPQMALIHQITVVVFLLYFPFGKLFHLPIRPLATAVPMNYQEEVGVDTKNCIGCDELYSNDDQITDVQAILGQQNFDFEMQDGHKLSDYCPACRRKIRVMNHLNMPSPFGKTMEEPVQTNNGIHIPGFGRERNETFYEDVKGEK